MWRRTLRKHNILDSCSAVSIQKITFHWLPQLKICNTAMKPLKEFLVREMFHLASLCSGCTTEAETTALLTLYFPNFILLDWLWTSRTTSSTKNKKSLFFSSPELCFQTTRKHASRPSNTSEVGMFTDIAQVSALSVDNWVYHRTPSWTRQSWVINALHTHISVEIIMLCLDRSRARLLFWHHTQQISLLWIGLNKHNYEWNS